MLVRAPEEGALILQLFAGDRETLLRGAQTALELGGPFDGIGINMACPMPKVLKKGAGARLLERLDVAVSMVRGLKTLGLPVWPKIRKVVPRDGSPDTLAFASALIEAGADNVGIHGRTAAQRYEGRSDLEEVLRVARAFPGFISASGDMTGPESVAQALDGGCVSVFLARGAVADPFVVPRILAHLGYNVQDSPFLRASLEDRAELFATLADDLVSLHGERLALVLLRRTMSGMFRGVPGSAPYRRAIGAVSTWTAAHDLTRRWRQFFERGLFDE